MANNLDFLELLLQFVDFEASFTFGGHQLRLVPHLLANAFVHVQQQFHFPLVVVGFPVTIKNSPMTSKFLRQTTSS